MQPDSLSFIFLNAFLINNFVLAMFLGLCPFLGVSGKLKSAWNMGLAVTFVMLVSSSSSYLINLLLVRYELEFLRLKLLVLINAVDRQVNRGASRPLDSFGHVVETHPFCGLLIDLDD